jgi:single-stranded DNA-binding protein
LLNKVFLVGTLGDRGVTVAPLPESGALCGTFTLICTEPGDGERSFQPFVPCACYGKALAQAEQLTPGAVVALDGKLTRRPRLQHGEQVWELVVLAWSVTPLVPAARQRQEALPYA